MQLLTVAPELVTLDCSRTHVLQENLTISLTTVKSWMDWGYM